MKKIIAITLIFVLALSLFGCAEQTPEKNTITDREGNVIEIKDSYDKIISAAPSTTEILVDLGLADKIVAISDLDLTPGLADDVMKFNMMTPNIEDLISLEADILIASSMTTSDGKADPFAPLSELGTTVAYIPTSATIADIYVDIEFIGKLLGEEEKAIALGDSLKAEIEKIAEISATIPEEEKKTLYFEISPAPYMFTTGAGTYLDEMITLIGGINAFADLTDWVSVSDETILMSNPQFIFTNVHIIDDPAGEIEERTGWEAIDAVKNGNVYSVENNPTSLSNHNIIKGIKQMAEIMYPNYYDFS